MRKPLIYGGLLTLALGTGVGAAMAAPSGATTAQQLSAQIRTVEAQAAASHDSRLASELQAMNVAVSHSSGKPSSCPPTSPLGENGGGTPPCGIDHNGIGPLCPSPSSNAGNPPPCSTNGQGNGPGSSQGSGSGTGSTSTCGPADSGGSAPSGPVTSQVYNIGEQISANGGSQLGDPVQSLACAVNAATGL